MTKRKWILFGAIGVLIAGIVSAWIFWPEPEEPGYWDLKNAEYIEDNKTALPGQIVFLGDSLTDGYHLDDHFDSDLELYNRGIGGDVTGGVLARLDSNVLAISPSVVVLLIGVNDLHSGIPQEQIMANLETIITRIQTALPDGDIYLQSYYPTNAKNLAVLAEFWDDIDAMNVSARALAQEYGIGFIELHEALSDGDELNGTLTEDGVHLNEAGYDLVSAIIAENVPELRLPGE